MKRWIPILATVLIFLVAAKKDIDPTPTTIVPPIVGDGRADDTSVIQHAINIAPEGAVIQFPSGHLAKTVGPIYSSTKVGFDFNGTCLVSTGFTNDAAFVIFNETPGANYKGNRVPYRNICLQGPGSNSPGWGSGSGTAGLEINASNFGIEEVNIQGYNKGLGYSDNAYGVTIFDPQIIGNYRGMWFPYPPPINSGEQFTFTGGSISNNAIGVEDEGSVELNFTGTSFDYNGQQFVSIGGPIRLNQVHIEGIFNPPFSWPYNGANPYAHLIVRDSDIISGGTGLISLPLIDTQVTSGASADFEHVFLSGFTQDATDFTKWCTGPGCNNVSICDKSFVAGNVYAKLGPFQCD